MKSRLGSSYSRAPFSSPDSTGGRREDEIGLLCWKDLLQPKGIGNYETCYLLGKKFNTTSLGTVNGGTVTEGKSFDVCNPAG